MQQLRQIMLTATTGHVDDARSGKFLQPVRHRRADETTDRADDECNSARGGNAGQDADRYGPEKSPARP
jgi:hypothetical protein